MNGSSPAPTPPGASEKRPECKAQGEKGRLQKNLYLKGPIQRCTFLFRQAQQLQEVALSLYLQISRCSCWHFGEQHFKRRAPTFLLAIMGGKEFGK